MLYFQLFSLVSIFVYWQKLDMFINIWIHANHFSCYWCLPFCTIFFIDRLNTKKPTKITIQRIIIDFTVLENKTFMNLVIFLDGYETYISGLLMFVFNQLFSGSQKLNFFICLLWCPKLTNINHGNFLLTFR